MSAYKQILAAVDLAEGSAQVVQRANELANSMGAKLRLVHVVQPIMLTAMPSQQALPGPMVDMAEVLSKAQQQLEGLAREVDLPRSECEVVEGPLRNAIVRVAQESSADLIVVGNNERHGLDLLLSKPTGDVVSRRAPCDVLEVRLGSS